MLPRIFSIEKNKDHIIYNFLSLKLKIKIFDKTKYNLFFLHSIKPKTILIIEINGSHWETIPGIFTYLTKLGYNVDILTRTDAEKIFDSINEPIEYFEVGKVAFDKIIKTYDFSKYERIIYNSKRVYFKKNDINSEGYDLEEYYDFIPKGQKENIYIQHHIDKINDFYKPNQIILANPSKNPELDKYVVNPHYFGEFDLKNFKNKDVVNFISIGELSEKRRNSQLLISAVKTLHNTDINNFKITIIGKGQLEELEPDIQKYFEILGRVDYQTMFKKLNESDFILSLLDPDLKAHKRYMESGTSGTFQLIYGFNKPCVIHKTFADIYNFNKDNSLIYESNNEFVNTMQKAINMTDEEYKNLQRNLDILTKKIERISIKNMEELMNE